MAKHYELTYTISKNLTPEEANSLLERVSSHLPQAAASERGYDFFNLEFYAEPETIPELESKIRAESQIKNHLLVKRGKARLVKTRTRKMPEQTQTPAQEQKVKKVELKEIDQKLKEIFGE